MGRRANGDGTIYQKKDGRWFAEVNVTLANGVKDRKIIPGKKGESRESVKKKLDAVVAQERQRIPFAEKKWTVAEWLDYWLENSVAVRLKATTADGYGFTVKNHIKPLLGKIKLIDLSVRDVQVAIDRMAAEKRGGRAIHKFRQVLSSALSDAMREEIIFRNVSRLARLPSYRKKKIIPWTSDETVHFLETVKNHPWLLGFLLLLVYGMRKGEVLGLSADDLDFSRGKNGFFRIRQQLQRQRHKGLVADTLKTENSSRELPMIPLVRALMLAILRSRGIDPANCYKEDAECSTENLLLLSSDGTPVEPRNFYRVFTSLTEKARLPRITVHTTRHIAATLLKKLGVPIRDAQLILGHASPLTTTQIYQHDDEEGKEDALNLIGRILNAKETEENSCTAMPVIELDSSDYCQINCQTMPNNQLMENVNDTKTPPLTEVFHSRNFGGLAGARTQDTGLKRNFLHTVKCLPTPVIQNIQSCTKTQIAVATTAKLTAKTDDSAQADLEERLLSYRAMFQACQEVLQSRN